MSIIRSEAELEAMLRHADAIRVQDAAIQQLTLGALESLGKLSLEHNNQLTSLDLPQLRAGGEFNLSSLAALVDLEFPALQIVGNMNLADNVTLGRVALPALKVGGALYIQWNDKLSSLQLPQLQRVESSIGIFNNPQLEVRRVVGTLRSAAIPLSHECNQDDDCYEPGC